MKLHYYPETDSLYIELKPTPGAKAREIVEGLVDDREPDDGIDDVGVEMQVREHAEEQCDRMADAEHRHVNRNVFQAVEKEDHADEEEQMVVAREHVLGAQV